MCLNLVTTTSQVRLLISDCSKILPEIHASPIFPCRIVLLFLTENYKPMGSRGDLFYDSWYFHCRRFRQAPCLYLSWQALTVPLHSILTMIFCRVSAPSCNIGYRLARSPLELASWSLLYTSCDSGGTLLVDVLGPNVGVHECNATILLFLI